MVTRVQCSFNTTKLPNVSKEVSFHGRPGNEMYNIWNKEVVQDIGGGCAILNVKSDINFPDFLSYEKCKNRHNFICVKHLRITLPCGTIDNDYVQLPRLGNCYKVHHSAAPWRLAFRSCLMEDAHLTTNFLHISTELDLQPTVSYYVGIHRVPGNNAYRFLNGTEVGDNFFLMYGDPGETSCVVLNNERFLQGYPCGAEFPFICQKKTADKTDVPRE
ncbi:hypothetical protein EVAR_20388_1 [Eumeta japonica]|uniref:C-type lectin domain-containing protein n=1 Tax=Eumeta variegata TaxID=151549 RepID=A0A4C1TY61_EUMVA|nr:hypothetical protein EVAR_20388_1 [Eumeta japonica]